MSRVDESLIVVTLMVFCFALLRSCSGLADAQALKPDCQALPWVRLETATLGDGREAFEDWIESEFAGTTCDPGGCVLEPYWCAWPIPPCDGPLPCAMLDFCEQPSDDACVRRCIDCKPPSLGTILACNFTKGCRVQDLMDECAVTGVDLREGCPAAGNWYGTLVLRINNVEVERFDFDAARVFLLAPKALELLREIQP